MFLEGGTIGKLSVEQEFEEILNCGLTVLAVSISPTGMVSTMVAYRCSFSPKELLPKEK